MSWCMRFKRQKMYWILAAALAALGVAGNLTGVTLIDAHQFRQNAKLLRSFRLTKQPASTLVVYFSRSGNTEVMAYQLAEIKHAHLLNIKASDYRIGFTGWRHAMRDARNTQAVISTQPVDLAAYDTIYIGSPIWLYSPAPPVFEFVKTHDLTGKKVILFNTLNSKFEQQYIDNFAALVRQRGGAFSQHLYIIRGRMTRQLDTQPFLDSVKAIVRQ